MSVEKKVGAPEVEAQKVGYSAAEFCKSLGFSKTTLYEIMKGPVERRPRVFKVGRRSIFPSPAEYAAQMALLDAEAAVARAVEAAAKRLGSA